MKAANTFIACPICQKKFDIGLTLAMPFCSERCRRIDLGRWMEEGYGLPAAPNLDDEEAYEESSGYSEEN